MIIAIGVNNPKRAGTRQKPIYDQAHHHRWQTHQSIERGDRRTAKPKPANGKPCAKGQRYCAGNHEGREADLKCPQRNLYEICIKRNDEPECRLRFRSLQSGPSQKSSGQSSNRTEGLTVRSWLEKPACIKIRFDPIAMTAMAKKAKSIFFMLAVPLHRPGA